VKIVKKERDPSLFTSKQLDMTENRIFTLCRMIAWVVFLRMFWNVISSLLVERGGSKIYPPLPTSVQPISITKTIRIVPTKNERGPPLFTSKLLIKFQNILRNTTQVIKALWISQIMTLLFIVTCRVLLCPMSWGGMWLVALLILVEFFTSSVLTLLGIAYYYIANRILLHQFDIEIFLFLF
jgi:hypothetical protein